MSQDDEQLVRDCRSGDPFAFGPLVERYQSMVCSIAYAHLGDESASEDVGQECFIEAWRKLGTLREPRRFAGWLARIARNRAIDAARRLRPDRSRAGPVDPDEVAGCAQSPEEDAIAGQDSRLLWAGLARLPASVREPLVLYYREGRSVSDVARLLDLSEEATRQRLHRGRTLLRDSLLERLEDRLERSRPGVPFTAAVLVALPRAPVPTVPAPAARTLSARHWATIAGGVAAVTLGAFWILPGRTSPVADRPGEPSRPAVAGDTRDPSGVEPRRLARTSDDPPPVSDPDPVLAAARAETLTVAGQVVLPRLGVPCPHALVMLLGETPASQLADGTEVEEGQVVERGLRAIATATGHVEFHNVMPGPTVVRVRCPAETRAAGDTPFLERSFLLVVRAGLPVSSWALDPPEHWYLRRPGDLPPLFVDQPAGPPGTATPFESVVRDPRYETPAPCDDTNADGELSAFEWGIFNNIAGRALEAQEEDASGQRVLVLMSDAAAPEGVRLATSNAPAVGPSTAPVEIVEVLGPVCPFSAAAHASIETLLAEFPGQLHVSTVISTVGESTELTGRALCAAQHLDAFFPYLKLVHEEVAASLGDQGRSHLAELAARAGMESEAFEERLDGPECGQAVAARAEELSGLGLNATPILLVNGKVVAGVRDLDFYRDLVVSQLAEATR